MDKTMKHLVTLADWNTQEITGVVELAREVKANPKNHYETLAHRTLIMMFEKPSLRTHLSFDVAMYQLGGHSIYYNLGTSPAGKKKESTADMVRVISRYADILMARLFSHRTMIEMAQYATIPVINGLTNFSHPCQILSDLLTISEKKGKLAGLKLAYFGDSCNNVTHSLLYGCAQTGISIAVGCPAQEQYCPNPGVVQHARDLGKNTGVNVSVHSDPREAAKDADVVYTDSWMSYHVPPEEEPKRLEALMPYQVNSRLMSVAKPDAIFMNCLPALRGYEQTGEVIDGPQSVVFDQAENRLHAQKAILIKLLSQAQR